MVTAPVTSSPTWAAATAGNAFPQLQKAPLAGAFCFVTERCYNAAMTRLARRFKTFLSLSALLPLIASAQGLADKVKDALAAKYPGEQIVASCSTAILGNTRDVFAALYGAHDKRIRVISVMQNGGTREIDVVPATRGSSFELQCLNAKEAKQRKKVLGESETIRDFLRVPAGRGAVCYFTSDTETKCWSKDKSGKLIEVGGWQT